MGMRVVDEGLFVADQHRKITYAPGTTDILGVCEDIVECHTF